MKERIKTIQRTLGVSADGIIGPMTLSALEGALGIVPATVAQVMPTQAEVRSGKSIFGAPGDAQLVRIAPPYPLFYEGRQLSTISVHRCIADRVTAALKEVLAVYGAEKIHALGLDQYGGCYNYRKTTSGSTLSMHAWGIALDFCPVGNEYATHAPKATLSRAECAKWWEIWEKHGATSMGRARDFDWMHLQFARL